MTKALIKATCSDNGQALELATWMWQIVEPRRPEPFQGCFTADMDRVLAAILQIKPENAERAVYITLYDAFDEAATIALTGAVHSSIIFAKRKLQTLKEFPNSIVAAIALNPGCSKICYHALSLCGMEDMADLWVRLEYGTPEGRIAV